MREVRLLPGERQELQLRPHPLSFLPGYFAAALPALWGLALFWMVRADWWGPASGTWWKFWEYLYGYAPNAYVIMFLGLGILGAIAAVSQIRWRIFFAYMGMGVIAAVMGVIAAQVWNVGYQWSLPIMLWLLALPGILGAELFRRSHHYTLTNLRIIFRGGFVVRRERQLRYEAITDLDGQQGPLGRLLGYGTLIPVTQSGFGLGADSSQAFIGMGAGGRGGAKAGPAEGGVGAGIGVAAGGGKDVQVARARTYNQLTGVLPYGDVKYLLETLIQNATATPYLRQQVELQQKMVDALSGMQGRGAALPVFEGETVE